MKTCLMYSTTLAGVSAVFGVSCVTLASEAADVVNAVRIIITAAIVSGTLVNVCGYQ